MDEQCGNDADYRYTWPGRDEAFVCEKHAVGITRIADAIGLHLQLIPVTAAGPFCSQKVNR